MRQQAKNGFSLIEFMVALLITIIVVGGFTMALNKITIGTRNATRSTDLTNLSRGVFKLMQSDFYKTWKGLSDLNIYQVHVAMDNEDKFFYGISDIGYSAVGASHIELQWFDSHREWKDVDSGVIYNLPTYLSTNTWLLKDPEQDPPTVEPGEVWASTIPPLILMSTLDDDPDLKNIDVGDYFLLYRADAFYNSETYALKNLVDHIDPGTGLFDETGLKNGAMLLQVSAVADSGVPGDYDCGAGVGFSSARKLTFGGTTFLNNLGTNPLTVRVYNDDRGVL